MTDSVDRVWTCSASIDAARDRLARDLAERLDVDPGEIAVTTSEVYGGFELHGQWIPPNMEAP